MIDEVDKQLAGINESFDLFLVGIDVVGDKVLELNVFSPGGLYSAMKFEGVNFHQTIIDALERKVDFVKHYPLDFDNVKLATL